MLKTTKNRFKLIQEFPKTLVDTLIAKLREAFNLTSTEDFYHMMNNLYTSLNGYSDAQKIISDLYSQRYMFIKAFKGVNSLLFKELFEGEELNIKDTQMKNYIQTKRKSLTKELKNKIN